MFCILDCSTSLETLLATNTHPAAKHALRIDTFLNLQKTVVVATEERVLPVLLVVALVVVGGRSEDFGHVCYESSG